MALQAGNLANENAKAAKNSQSVSCAALNSKREHLSGYHLHEIIPRRAKIQSVSDSGDESGMQKTER